MKELSPIRAVHPSYESGVAGKRQSSSPRWRATRAHHTDSSPGFGYEAACLVTVAVDDGIPHRAVLSGSNGARAAYSSEASWTNDHCRRHSSGLLERRDLSRVRDATRRSEHDTGHFRVALHRSVRSSNRSHLNFVAPQPDARIVVTPIPLA